MMRKFFKLELFVFLGAFALYSYLGLFAPADIWNSPDETANAFFISRLAAGGGLTVADQAVIRSGGLIHPRSISVSDGLLVPGSFLGMIVFYSLPVRIFGAGILPFLTPFFSALAIVALGSILKKFLPARAARISMLLSAAHPALWYYSNRGLFPNALFFDCVIFAFYFFICSPFETLDKKYGSRMRVGVVSDGFLGGAAFVLAAAVRTSELVWLLPLSAVLLWYGRKKINKIKFLSALGVVAFSGIIFAYLSSSLYGHVSAGGYFAGSGGIGLWQMLFPFGLSLRNILWNGYYFGGNIFWWYAVLTAVSIIYLFMRRGEASGLKKYLLLLLPVSIPMILIYGSGRYLDTPDPSLATVGVSTVRYWLPLYIGTVPFAGWFLDRLMAKGNVGRTAATGFLVIVLMFSARAVFWGRGEGLTLVIRELGRYENIRKEVLAKTDASAIIITDRNDKIFFPFRSVVIGTQSPAVIASLRSMSSIGPFYVYTLKMAEDDPRITAYGKAGFVLSSELEFGNERLYRLRSVK